MKSIQINYFLAWMLPIVIVALYWGNVIPPCTTTFQPTFLYVFTYVCQLSTLILIYLSVKMPYFDYIKKQMPIHFVRWNLLRQAVINILICINFLGYYITLNESFLYIIGIILIAYIFCYPIDHKP